MFFDRFSYIPMAREALRENNKIVFFYMQRLLFSRYYDIADEYLSQEVGYNIKIISMHLDAFYTNSDNLNIPIMEALRIVSLIQDGEQKTANVRLLQAQQKYGQ